MPADEARAAAESGRSESISDDQIVRGRRQVGRDDRGEPGAFEGGGGVNLATKKFIKTYGACLFLM